MTVPPACYPIWSSAPSPLFIPPPFSCSLIPVNCISSPVPPSSLRNHFQSHLGILPTPIFLPTFLSSMLSLPPPHTKVPRLVRSGVKFSVLHASPRARNTSALILWTETSPFVPAFSTLLQFLLIRRMELLERFYE